MGDRLCIIFLEDGIWIEEMNLVIFNLNLIVWIVVFYVIDESCICICVVFEFVIELVCDVIYCVWFVCKCYLSNVLLIVLVGLECSISEVVIVLKCVIVLMSVLSWFGVGISIFSRK